VVVLIFGQEFAPAAPALPVLGAAFVFICFGYLTDNVLFVIGRQGRLVWIAVIGLIVNLCGNLALVPTVGFMGAAWMTLVTEIVVFAASAWLIRRALDLPVPRAGRIARTLLAAVLLGLALEALSLLSASLAVLIVFACLCYPALLFGLRAVGMDDVRVVLGR